MSEGKIFYYCLKCGYSDDTDFAPCPKCGGMVVSDSFYQQCVKTRLVDEVKIRPIGNGLTKAKDSK
jgi:hypothetical protein